MSIKIFPVVLSALAIPILVGLSADESESDTRPPYSGSESIVRSITTLRLKS